MREDVISNNFFLSKTVPLSPFSSFRGRLAVFVELRWLLTAVIIHSSIILFILVLLYNVSYHTVSVWNMCQFCKFC